MGGYVLMFKNNKDFNKITVYIILECDSEHPIDTVRNVLELINAVSEYFDSFYSNYIKESIDIEILKSLRNKIGEYKEHLNYNDMLIKSMNEEYKKHYKISSADMISPYAIPTSSFEVTLSELVMMYRALEFGIENRTELKTYIFLPWSGASYYYNIKQIQEYLKSRLGYALLNSISADKY